MLQEVPSVKATSLIQSLEALKNLILDLNKDSSPCVDSSDGELVTSFEPRIEVVFDKVHIRRCPASTAQSKAATISSWEEEFGDELLDLPLVEGKDEIFDPVGDLDELQELLYGKPIENVQRENDSQAVEFNKSKNMVTRKPPLNATDDRPPILRNDDPSSEKAHCHANRSTSKTRHSIFKIIWHHRDERLLHYMNCVRFGPGKFKWLWHESFSVQLLNGSKKKLKK